MTEYKEYCPEKSYMDEVPTNKEGQFRFFAAPGKWTLVVQAQGARVEQSVIAAQGTPVDLVISL